MHELYHKPTKKQPLGLLVRVERIELSSQVWKTCILTTVLYPQIVNLGRETGIEPATFWTTIRRSNQLSYSRHVIDLIISYKPAISNGLDGVTRAGSLEAEL